MSDATMVKRQCSAKHTAKHREMMLGYRSISSQPLCQWAGPWTLVNPAFWTKNFLCLRQVHSYWRPGFLVPVWPSLWKFYVSKYAGAFLYGKVPCPESCGYLWPCWATAQGKFMALKAGKQCSPRFAHSKQKQHPNELFHLFFGMFQSIVARMRHCWAGQGRCGMCRTELR